MDLVTGNYYFVVYQRGSAIAKIIGVNTKGHAETFHEQVNMWVYEERLPDGRLLSKVINEEHENPKYLPGHKLPDNVTAIPDLVEAARDASILVFVIPHQFVRRCCETLRGKIDLQNVRAISLAKGVDVEASSKGLKRVSELIGEALNIPVAVLMGANIADEVAMEQFCEATIGVKQNTDATIFKLLFQTHYFKVKCSVDVVGVELCGALKNVVAIAAGVVDGLGLGANTKAAVMRIGLEEMRRFCKTIDSTVQDETFFESCGVADLITTCFGGRNRRIGEAMARTGRHVEYLEAELLNGQKLQGPLVSKEIYFLNKERRVEDEYPLMTTVYKMCYEGYPCSLLIKSIN